MNTITIQDTVDSELMDVIQFLDQQCQILYETDAPEKEYHTVQLAAARAREARAALWKLFAS